MPLYPQVMLQPPKSNQSKPRAGRLYLDNEQNPGGFTVYQGPLPMAIGASYQLGLPGVEP